MLYCEQKFQLQWIMKDLEYYKKILGIVDKYDEKSLKQAFYDAVKKNHPDKFKKNQNKELATKKMKLINEAYDFLKLHINEQNNFSNSNESSQKQESDNNSEDNYTRKSDTAVYKRHYTDIIDCFLILVPFLILLILFTISLILLIINFTRFLNHILIFSMIISIPMYLRILFLAIKFKKFKLLSWAVICLILVAVFKIFSHNNEPLLIFFLSGPAQEYFKAFEDSE